MKLPVVAPHDGDANDRSLPLVQEAQEDFFVNDFSAGAASMPAKKRSLKGLWITLAVVFGLILAAYIGFAVYFMNHFSFNTSINGIPVAFQTAEEVDGHLADDLGNYSLLVEAREGQKVTVRATDIDLHYVADGRVEELLENQNEWLWPLSLLPESASDVEHVSVEFDEQKLQDYLAATAIMDEAQMRAPVDAHLAFEGNVYVIDPGDEGTTLDAQKATEAIKNALDTGATTLNLEETGLYLAPTVAATDAGLIADCETFNQYVPFRITYTLGDRVEVLDGYTTLNWVDTSGEAPYALDTAAVEAWVADFASRYDTLGSTRTIVNGFGVEKSVTGGTYGWQVDQEAEFWAILTAAEQRLGEVREPHLLGSAASLGAQDWGATYLEVDISDQYMWYFVDGVCVLETDVVTGNPNTGYATPEGVWYIFSKSYNVITRGDPLPGGGYEWETPVTYWMPFTPSGCGFHDAYWQPTFGGTWYLTNGSHGCINMPSSLAAELMEMVEVGTPVITHH